MALHVSPEILEQYHGFYSLALDGTTDDGCALVLENVPAAGLRAALEAVPEPDALRTVLIESCPELQSLSFLENFPALEWVYVRRCPAVAALWDTARTPALLCYAHSKHAVLLFALALARREAPRVCVCAADPGIVCTGITRHLPAVIDRLWQHLFVAPLSLPLTLAPVSFPLPLTSSLLLLFCRHVARSAATGAQTAVHCVLAPPGAVPSGCLWRDCRAVPCAGAALAPAAQDRLWAQTERLLAACT